MILAIQLYWFGTMLLTTVMLIVLELQGRNDFTLKEQLKAILATPVALLVCTTELLTRRR